MLSSNIFSPVPLSDAVYLLEYSDVKNQDGKEQYCFHFTFETEEMADRMFKKMKNEWSLPVILEGNRIIVDPAKSLTSTGVYQYKHLAGCDVYPYVGIRFTNQECARDFYDWSESINKNKQENINKPKMICNYGCIYFDKDTIINPKYYLNIRVNKMQLNMQLINVMMCSLHRTFFTYSGQPADDVVCYLMKMLLDMPYMEQFFKLSNQFSLHKHKLSFEQTPKMNVSVKGVMREKPDSEKYSLFFVCEIPDQADELVNALKPFFRGSIEKAFNNMIEIKSGYYGMMGTLPGIMCDTYTRKFFIQFESSIDQYKFLNLINITNASFESDGNGLTFKERPLELNMPKAHFYYDENDISFNREAGTHVHVQASDSFVNWFNGLPLQSVEFYDGLQIFKFDPNTLSYGFGKGKPGIQIKKTDDGFIVCNNISADKNCDTVTEKKQHLISKLKTLDTAIESIKNQPVELIHYRNEVDNGREFNKVEKSGDSCTIS